MQLVRRLGSKAYPAPQTACAGGSNSNSNSNFNFNCTANLTVTSSDGEAFEALVVNHPTGPYKLPFSAVPAGAPSIPPVRVTVVFAGGTAGESMPARVSVRRVDATHANALPAYVALGSPQYPNATTLRALVQASEFVEEQLVPTRVPPTSAQSAVGGGGAWQVELTMPAYSVAGLSFRSSAT